MRVAVVTPFYRTPPEWLAQCHASVRAQTHPCTHVLVSDGSGANPVAGFEGEFVRLERNHNDYGDTPRAVGFACAVAAGHDAIAVLDGDNWYRPDHVASLVALHQRTGARVCASARELYDLDGALLGRCPEVNGTDHVDTSCLFFTRRAFALALNWPLMPRACHPIGDLWMLRVLQRGRVPFAFSGEATLAYRTTWPIHYRHFGREPPAGAKPESHCRHTLQIRREIDRLMPQAQAS